MNIFFIQKLKIFFFNKKHIFSPLLRRETTELVSGAVVSDGTYVTDRRDVGQDSIA